MVENGENGKKKSCCLYGAEKGTSERRAPPLEAQQEGTRLASYQQEMAKRKLKPPIAIHPAVLAGMDKKRKDKKDAKRLAFYGSRRNRKGWHHPGVGAFAYDFPAEQHPGQDRISRLPVRNVKLRFD
jgi:hypothetical protein